jgi:tetratricopeptide (TPR) repeat protein
LLSGCTLPSPHNLSAGTKTQHLRQLDAQLLLARAEWLLTRKRILNEMIRSEPGNVIKKWDLRNTDSQIRGTAKELNTLGSNALDLHELDTADLCLTMADRLSPTVENTLALAKLEDIRYKKKLKQYKKSQQIEQKRLELKNTKLIKETKTAIANNNLIHASGLLKKIRKNKTQDEEIKNLKKSLDTAIQARTKILLEEGNHHYSNGNIKQAKSTWEKALQLDPENNMIRERIKRADRVLEKLKQLKKEKH